MRVKLLDLPSMHQPIRADIHAAVTRVIDSGTYIMGPEVDAFEAELAEYVGSRKALAVSSGSDALLLSLMAIGIVPGDEVITTPFTFFATVGAIVRLGAVPVFADILPDSFNIDPTRIGRLVNRRTRCILPVHLYGQCADMAAISRIANSHGIPVIEDAAQAIGARTPDDRKAGTLGAIGCLSFFPSKNLGALGDAGMVMTDDADLYARLKRMRAHGAEPKYFHREIGGNFRMDALQAAILRVKLKRLDEWTQARRQRASWYREGIRAAGLLERGIVLPLETWPELDMGHIYHQFVLRVPKRDELRAFLKAREIDTEIYYPLPMHLQECFRSLGHKKGDYPVAESAADQTLAIPIDPTISRLQVEHVVASLAQFYRC